MPGLTAIAELRQALPALLSPVAGEQAIGLAVSGGPDSLALMLLVCAWAGAAAGRPRVVVYSVDHGLRPEAAAEVAFVCREAARLGLVARALRWEGAKPAAGIQAAARAARYRLIGEAMRADGVQVLLTAHHQDDQAETVLMRLAHGSGLEGLRGMDRMAEVEGVRVFRPLLGVPRRLLGAVVEAAGRVPVADPGNADPRYERVRWRRALPAVAALGLDGEAIATLARRAGDADAAVGQWADTAFAELATIDSLGAASLPAAALMALPRAVGIKVLARLLDRVGGGRAPRALGAVERLHERLMAGQRAATLLGASIGRRGDVLWVVREPGRHPLAPVAVDARAAILWDRRFRIANNSRLPLSVSMGQLPRHAAEGLVGARLMAPAAAIRSAPLVRDEKGEVWAFGEYLRNDLITVNFAGRGANTVAP